MSMYSEVNRSEDLLDAAEDILAENPNAISVVLDDDDDGSESAPFAMMPSFNNNNTISDSNTATTSNSLLERIQQQKNAMNASSSTSNSHSAILETPSPAPAPSLEEEEEFGYPPIRDDYTYSTGPTTQQQQQQQSSSSASSVHVPNYDAPRGPNPYDTSSKRDTAFHQVLSVAGNVASRAYQGTKSVVSGMMGTPPSSSQQQHQQHQMSSMDYQRESLLMDPHEMEESGMMGAGAGGNVGNVRGFFGTSSEQESNGLMGGMSGMETSSMHHERRDGAGATTTTSSSTVVRVGYTMLGYLKTFCIDIKDLFLSSSRNVQAIVVVLVILISWLLFSEV